MYITRSYHKPILLWLIANLFFAYQFILRLSVGILREEIIQKFAIDTVAFGTLAGYYYLGYAGLQIPIGIMLDKFNIKFVMAISIIITSLGTLAFITATNWHYLLIGRFLIGAGSAVGFLSIAKITKSFFDPKYHAIMLGFAFTFGLVGAVFGVTPMKILFNNYGYNHTFYSLIFTGIAISILTLTINIKSLNSEHNTNNQSPNLYQIIKLLLNPNILIIGLSGGLMVGSLEGFADVWAIPFFKQIYTLTDAESNLATSFVYIGMCVGGPLLALLTTYVRSQNLMIFLTGLFTILIFLTLYYFQILSFITCSILMFLLGIFCCYQVLVFNLTTNFVSPASAGLAIAIVNCINMSFGHFFHKVMSILISYKWAGQVNELGLPVYSRFDFILATSIVPICCIFGMIGFIYMGLKNKQ